MRFLKNWPSTCVPLLVCLLFQSPQQATAQIATAQSAQYQFPQAYSGETEQFPGAEEEQNTSFISPAEQSSQDPFQQSLELPPINSSALPSRYTVQAEVDEEDPLLPYGLHWSKHGITTTILPGGDGGMGVTTVDLQTQLYLDKFPLLRLTPRFGWDFIDGPDFTDVPNQLYQASLDFSLYLPMNERWSFLGGVSPGIYSDFDNNSSDAFRIMGRALFNYKHSEQLKISFGFVYLDRDDVVALPAVGLSYSPASMPEFKFDLLFPKPRISYRYHQDVTREKLVYLAGEFGGGTWAIERSNGNDDTLTYSDLKLILGIEHSLVDDFTWFAEAGYVFNRSLEYSVGPEIDLDSTGMIRAGIRY